ncbi:MAG: hypothetical protein CVV27_08070 [Candidatus Melainabacteria bacterium HGW-Melainabacteria-1]|nr:MAG: hypothetical protein CVV27_08070 [Candidatus Melainabacteria bacterium HGW-Melainabacteria-1]
MKRQQGISLPEVLVAAVLLGLAIFFITPMISYGFKSSHLNKERSAAVQAGQGLIEEIRQVGFAGALSIVNPSTPSAVLSDDLQGNKLYITGTGEVSTTPGSNTKLLQVQRLYYFSAGNTPSPVDDLIQITIKINWPGSADAHVTMGTTLARSVAE